MNKQDDLIVVGKFGASYGIRGWLKVIFLHRQFRKYFRLQTLDG